MMARPTPPPARKSSTPWERLKPIKQDPLESMGFVSKGDDRLLDPKTQETYYHKIVARYMTFCSTYSKDLDAAFASLSLSDSAVSASSDPTRNPPIRPREPGQTTVTRTPTSTSTSTTTQAPAPSSLLQSKYASPSPSTIPRTTAPSPKPASRTSTPSPSPQSPPSTSPDTELSTILLSLRKLREGLLATTKTSISLSSHPHSNSRFPSQPQNQSVHFSQRVHVFSIRAAILAFHPPSYHPSLLHLLGTLHSKTNPLPHSELVEMTTYLILDLAFRQSDLIAAYTLRHRAKAQFQYSNRDVDQLLRCITTNDWIVFWRVRRRVDGYVRAMMHWYQESMRKTVLKAFGRAYLKSDVKWIIECSTGGTMGWEELVEKERIGWLREDGKDSVVIRKLRVK